MRSYDEYLARHIPLAMHYDDVFGDRLKYTPLTEGNAFWNNVEAAYSCQNRLTSTNRFFDVKRFDWYKEVYGIEVEGAAFVLDAADRVLVDSRLDTYLIVLGGKVTINGQILPEADGYHLVVKRNKQSVLVMQDSHYQTCYRREDFRTVPQLLAG